MSKQDRSQQLSCICDQIRCCPQIDRRVLAQSLSRPARLEIRSKLRRVRDPVYFQIGGFDSAPDLSLSPTATCGWPRCGLGSQAGRLLMLVALVPGTALQRHRSLQRLPQGAVCRRNTQAAGQGFRPHAILQVKDARFELFALSPLARLRGILWDRPRLLSKGKVWAPTPVSRHHSRVAAQRRVGRSSCIGGQVRLTR